MKAQKRHLGIYLFGSTMFQVFHHKILKKLKVKYKTVVNEEEKTDEVLRCPLCFFPLGITYLVKYCTIRKWNNTLHQILYKSRGFHWEIKISNLDFLSLTVKNVGPNLDQAATLLHVVLWWLIPISTPPTNCYSKVPLPTMVTTSVHMAREHMKWDELKLRLFALVYTLD